MYYSMMSGHVKLCSVPSLNRSKSLDIAAACGSARTFRLQEGLVETRAVSSLGQLQLYDVTATDERVRRAGVAGDGVAVEAVALTVVPPVVDVKQQFVDERARALVSPTHHVRDTAGFAVGGAGAVNPRQAWSRTSRPRVLVRAVSWA